jgi:serine/threonine-protein kinase
MSSTERPGTAGTGDTTRWADVLSGTAYRALQWLGEGSMGLVVEAEHLALGNRVVVKLLHEALAERADFVDRMRIEAQSLARMRHPNLVAVTDFSVTPAGIPFLVMERLAGHTLADERAERGAFPVEEAIDIARQTLAGLTAVHETGIIHRDIKAGNLFVCDGPPGQRVVKLLDFGIAKVLSSAPVGRAPQPLRYPTAEGVTVGTPRCLSPEQARGATVDARTDVYAVGVLLYALLVGAGPFDHIRGQVELLHAHVSEPPVPPSLRARQAIPAEVEAAVMRALSKRPDERFASAAEFSAALALASPAHARLATEPASTRYDTEPLPSVSVTASEPTLWIPPVASAAAPAEPSIAPVPVVAFNAPAPTTPHVSLGVSVVVVTVSAFASAGLAALLAWALLFRG